MNTQKFFLSGIAGGIAHFFAGYLIYGLLLMDYMTKNTSPGISRPDSEMIWWALMLGSICFGFMLSYVFNKVAFVSSAGSGAATGFIIALFMGASVDFVCYATLNIYNLNAVLADIPAMAVMGAIAGAVVALVNGLGKK